MFLRGDIALSDVEEIREVMIEAVETQQALLINCSAATYFDNAALQFLASLRLEARSLGVALQIEGLPGSVLADATPRGSAAGSADRRMAG
jgi:anti-anti-sigma regulatory factor